MSAAWALYYAMVAAHLVGGGYTLVRGQRVHRLVLLVLALGVVLQLAGCAALVALHVPIASVSINFDFILNMLMGFGLLSLTILYPQANWIIIMMGLQACNIGLDGFIFDENWADLRSRFADAANALNIVEISVLAYAAARARRARKAMSEEPPYGAQPGWNEEWPASEETGQLAQAASAIESGARQA